LHLGDERAGGGVVDVDDAAGIAEGVGAGAGCADEEEVADRRDGITELEVDAGAQDRADGLPGGAVVEEDRADVETAGVVLRVCEDEVAADAADGAAGEIARSG